MTPNARVLFFLLIFFTSATLVSTYFYYWWIAFNSDYALIGLMAKSWLERGDVPIFVWKVGYQGVLLEVGAVALGFHFFGISPRSLNIAPCFFFFGLLISFFFSVRAFLSEKTAWWATAFLVLGSPSLYHVVVRTQPNYVETFIFGSGLLAIYHRFLLHFYSNDRLSKRAELFFTALFGLILGFAWYTYAQIFYFLMAMGFHQLLFYFRAQSGFSLFPKTGQSGVESLVVGVSKAFVLLCVTTGLYLEFFHQDHLQIGHWRVGSSLLANLSLAAVAIVASHLWVAVSRARVQLRPHAGLLRVFFVSVGLGLLPKLYYNIWLKLPSLGKTSMAGNLADFFRRTGYFFEGQILFLNLQRWLGSGFPVAAVVGLAIAFFTFTFSKRTLLFANGEGDELDGLQIPPYLFIPPVCFFLFTFSDLTIDLGSVRYSLVLYLFYAVALGWTVTWGLSQRKWVRSVTILASLVVFLNNGCAFWQEFRSAPREVPALEAAQYLEDHGIHEAYGSYWASYTVSYLSNERVIVEPLEYNYNPHYAERVIGADRIAYLDFKPYKVSMSTPTVVIRDQEYFVESKASKGEVDIFILNKIARSKSAQ